MIGPFEYAKLYVHHAVSFANGLAEVRRIQEQYAAINIHAKQTQDEWNFFIGRKA